MKRIANLENNPRKDVFFILLIIYMLHLVFMIFVNNKTLVIDSHIFRHIYMFRIYRWILSLPIIYYFVKTYKKYEYFKTNEKLNVKDFNTYFALVFFIGNLCNLLIISIFKFKGRTPLINEPLYIDVIMAVFVAPILEEIVFRGVIMNNLRKYGIRVAIIINSLLFGLSHYNIEMIVPAFLTGIIFSYVACKYSIKYSILIHFFINAVTKISQVLILLRVELILILVSLFFAFLIIFLLIFFIIGLAKGRYKEIFFILKLNVEDRKKLAEFVKNDFLYLLIIFAIVVSNFFFNYKIF
ncbi:CPBP family intramembrane glutamic endopeptidase [Leptotrichia hongkongensis]|uniref:CPBP family intramembrane glutamic endopeptidase n=1 Tax=Leptotrichia hongkongensis TaxID=554406 RepID=UPI0035A82BF8